MEKQRTATWEIMEVTVTNIPVSGSGVLEGVHAEVVRRAELKVARVLLREGIPLCGEEVRFLRKLVGLSLEKFAAQFGLTGSGVRKWEEEKKKTPLEPVLQVALRAFFATRLNVRFPMNFNSLKGLEKRPQNLRIDYQEMEPEDSSVLPAAG